MLQKVENFQKYCVKWILSEDQIRYNSYSVYLRKCREVNLLPLSKLFDINDLVLIHKIVHELIPTKLPSHLTLFNGITRLRSTSCHLDSLSLVSSLRPSKFNETILIKSFFFRVHTKWNDLPLEIRQISDIALFRNSVQKYMWQHVLDDIDEIDDIDDYDTE